MIPKTHYKELLSINRKELIEGLENKLYRQHAIEAALKELLENHGSVKLALSVVQKEKLLRQIEKIIEETLKYYPEFKTRALPEIYREVIKNDKMVWFMAWGFVPQKDSSLIDSVLLAMHNGFNLQWNEKKFIFVMDIHLKHELGRNSIKNQMEAHMQKVFSIDNMIEMNQYYLLQNPSRPTHLHYLYLKNVLTKFYGTKKLPELTLAELERKYGASIRDILINDTAGLERLSKICRQDPIYQTYIKTVLLQDNLQITLKDKTVEKKMNKI